MVRSIIVVAYYVNAGGCDSDGGGGGGGASVARREWPTAAESMPKMRHFLGGFRFWPFCSEAWIMSRPMHLASCVLRNHWRL